MRFLVPLALVACATGCSDLRPPARPTSETTPAAARTAVETALVSVGLSQTGAVEIHAIAVKPIPWKGTEIPFDATRHAPPPGRQGWRPTQAPAGGPSDLDDTILDGGGRNPSQVIPSETGHRGALVVAHPTWPTPRVVPLSWGQPGEGHGDVTDRWSAGSLIWRAPWPGDGTEYRVVRVEPGPPALLARSRR